MDANQENAVEIYHKHVCAHVAGNARASLASVICHASSGGNQPPPFCPNCNRVDCIRSTTVLPKKKDLDIRGLHRLKEAKDWPLWRKGLMTQLTSKRLAYVLTTPCPEGPTAADTQPHVFKHKRDAVLEWEDDNNRVVDAIYRTMDEAFKEEIVDVEGTAKEVWEYVAHQCNTRTGTKKMILYQNLLAYKPPSGLTGTEIY